MLHYFNLMRTETYEYPFFVWGISRKKPDTQWKYNVILRRVRVTIVANGKELSITYSDCVSVVLLIHYATRIALCGLSSCTVFFHII